MKCLGNPKIRCNRCGREYTINRNWLEENSFNIGEGSMGEQIEHTFAYEMTCKKCNQLMYFKLRAFEYPVGAKEFQDSESKGCEIIAEPDIEVEYLPEEVISLYQQILNNPQDVYSLEPWEFEILVTEILSKKGYNASVTQKTRDGGKDIVASFQFAGVMYNTYFECKKYKMNRPVDVNVVRNLYAVIIRDGIDKGVIVTTSYFTHDAILEAEKYKGRIQLIDYEHLKSLMKN